jgi:DNA-binding XRE family transcriptional regulator
MKICGGDIAVTKHRQKTGRGPQRIRVQRRWRHTHKLVQVIAEKIIRTREALGLTQEDLAQQTGLDIPIIAAIENCEHLPTREVAQRLKWWLVDGWRMDGAKYPEDWQYHAALDPKKIMRVQVAMDAILLQKLDRVSENLGVPVTVLVNLALQQFLDRRMVLDRLSEARAQLEEARVRQAVSEAPQLVDLANADLESARRMGLRVHVKDTEHGGPMNDVGKQYLLSNVLADLPLELEGGYVNIGKESEE